MKTNLQAYEFEQERKMKAIVAVDLNWGIGYKGDLLKRIPEDMKFFRQLTINHVVIMGRGTFDSLPGRKPLKDRVNIVLSSTMEKQYNDVIICHTLDELLQELQKYNSDELYVIGGESIYKLLLPYCSEIYVTKILSAFTADKFLINLDQEPQWKIVSQSEVLNHDGIEYCFTKYTRQE